MIVSTRNGSTRPVGVPLRPWNAERERNPPPKIFYRERRAGGLGAAPIHHPLGPGAQFWGPLFGMAGLGAACPEGSSTKYTGPKVPGSDCFCSTGRIWFADGSRCISPQAPIQWQEASVSAKSKSGDQQAWVQQQIHPSAVKVLSDRGYSVDCHIDTNWAAVPGVPNNPPNICRVCGKEGCTPYEHAAYALNLNPLVALESIRTEQATRAAGFVPGSAASQTPEARAAITAAQKQMTRELGPSALPAGSPAATAGTTPPAPVNVIQPNGNGNGGGGGGSQQPNGNGNGGGFFDDFFNGDGASDGNGAGSLSQLQEFFTRELIVAGYGIPYWVIGAAAIGGALLFMGGRKR